MRRTTLAVIALAVVRVTAGGAADLPLSRVVLFSSGVGYFERMAEVSGSQKVELSFRTGQINDILKSMVLQDLGGGAIAPVTYAPQDPLDRILSSFSIDISDDPSVPELWAQLRGAKVKVKGQQMYEGTVLGAEKQQKSVGEQVMEFDVLNILTASGIQQVPLWHVENIELMDEKLNEELRRGLEAIHSARDMNKRPVVIQFNGEGQRKVRIGYLLETPVWKTSYRLMADQEGLFLQGWAIVENTTDDDWNGVNLAMVSGRPISFVQDLYEPLYIERPEVQPSVAAAAAPKVWDGAMEEAEEDRVAAKTMRAMPAPAPAMAPGMGFSGGMGGGYAMAEAAPEAPSMREGRTQSMASGGKVGTLFQYAINQPVSIPRQQSAMIPIINADIEGEKLSVYSQASDAKHPMNGIQLKNTSGLHLMAGPITVFAGNVYGGDALIDDVAPDEKRLVTYAMDLAVEVDPETKSGPQEFVAARVVRGIMQIIRKSRIETTYKIKNSADEKRVLLVEHPIRQDWKLLSPDAPEETTRSAYRFRVEVEAGKSAALPVVEEWPHPEIIRLADQDLERIELYLNMPELSAEMKAALEKLRGMLSELAALDAQRQEKETRTQEIEQEQERIRKNMAQLDRNSALYRQYVDKFTAQETEFEKLREDLRGIRESMTGKTKEIQDYLEGLEIG